MKTLAPLALSLALAACAAEEASRIDVSAMSAPGTLQATAGRAGMSVADPGAGARDGLVPVYAAPHPATSRLTIMLAEAAAFGKWPGARIGGPGGALARIVRFGETAVIVVTDIGTMGPEAVAALVHSSTRCAVDARSVYRPLYLGETVPAGYALPCSEPGV